jgi:hypothetical protein
LRQAASAVMDGSGGTRRNRITTAAGRRAAGVLIALALGLSVSAGNAQSTIVIPNAGEVTTTSKVDNGVLAVSNQVIRNRSQVRECVGVCFYAAKTATKTWICRQSNCVLDCSGREPVGGC